jgi:hypothetical protein
MESNEHDIEKIDALEEEIIELKYQLKKSKDKELIYKEILSDVDHSIKTLFKREAENDRFGLEETFNFRENLLNLKSSLDEFKRIYKLKF